MKVFILVLTLVGALTVWHIVASYNAVARMAYRYVRAESWAAALRREFQERVEGTDTRSFYRLQNWFEAELDDPFMDGRSVRQILGLFLFIDSTPERDAYHDFHSKRLELLRDGLGTLSITVATVLGLIYL